jgi:hypothetical protein
MFSWVIATYLAGVVVGLAVMRDPWPVRLATAAVWPLGIASLVIVTVILLLAAVYLWPIPMLAAIAVAIALLLALLTLIPT